jgi:outer membrane protein
MPFFPFLRISNKLTRLILNEKYKTSTPQNLQYLLGYGILSKKNFLLYNHIFLENKYTLFGETRMNRNLHLFKISLFAILFLFTTTPNSSALPRKVIGIVFDGPSELNQRALSIYKKEIIAVTEGEFDVRFPMDKIIQADWTAASVRSAIDTLLSDPRVDILITLGIIGSTEISKRRNLNKPVIAPWIIDRELIGLPINEKGASGIKNLYYLARPTTLSRDIQVFSEIVPFNRLALLYMPIVTELIPEIENVVQNIARQQGIVIVTIPAETSIDSTLASIPQDAQAVFIAPLLKYTQDELDHLFDGLIERKLPSFSMLGRNEVDRGVLAGLTPLKT